MNWWGAPGGRGRSFVSGYSALLSPSRRIRNLASQSVVGGFVMAVVGVFTIFALVRVPRGAGGLEGLHACAGGGDLLGEAETGFLGGRARDLRCDRILEPLPGLGGQVSHPLGQPRCHDVAVSVIG